MSTVGSPRLTRRETLRRFGAGAWLGLMSVSRYGTLSAGQTARWQGAGSAMKATFPEGAVIRTILKDLAPQDLDGGATLFHEHVSGTFNLMPPPRPPELLPGPVRPQSEAEYLDLMVEELKMACEDGMTCIVDAATGRRNDRQVENLKQMSIRSGMNLVIGGGYYQDLAISARYPSRLAQISEDELVEEFVRDAKMQRWGALGEIASSQSMQPTERKVFRAIGNAHLRTGLSIFTHTPHEGCPSCALEQLDIFESLGVDLHRVCIGHLSTIKPDAEPLAQTARAIAKRGAFLGFDTVGHLMGRSAIPDAHKVKYILAVLDAGYDEQILLSNDSTPVPQLKANWGNGFSAAIVTFVPKLRHAGVKDTTLHKILVDNPRRLLSFVPKQTS
jgi:phosphotriesterase-related protein